MADSDELIVRRNPVASGIRTLIGISMVSLGASLVRGADAELMVIAIVLMAIGVPQVVIGIHQLATRSPAVRANADGIWFGGGRVVPWKDISAIYEVHARVSVSFVPAGKGSLLRVDFRSLATTFRLPLIRWPMALLREGVVLHDDRPASVVARLEAMRARACGLDPVGAASLPRARVIER